MVDAGTLERVLSHIHNWFVRETFEVRNCEISGSVLPVSVTSKMIEGQWYRIEGSYLNDGLHLNPDTHLKNETFDAVVSLLAIPRPLLAVCEDIQAWISDYSQARAKMAGNPYQSESFGGYSYSFRGDISGDASSGGGPNGWQAAFASELNAWRKMY